MNNTLPINPGDLIQAITWYASGRGEKLTTLRLVKFLYLADLYYARVTKGTTLTGWPWSFVYFGPWCQQVNKAIENSARDGIVQTETNPSKYDDAKDYRLFWTDKNGEEPEVVNNLPIYVWSRLQWSIQKWVDDSYGLFAYVHFETEPMIQVKRGAVLDFSKARMPEVPKKTETKKISKANLQEARKAVDRLREKYRTAIDARTLQGPINTSFREAINKLDDLDLDTGLEGTAELEYLEPDRKP